jgi:hypothetical protein
MKMGMNLKYKMQRSCFLCMCAWDRRDTQRVYAKWVDIFLPLVDLDLKKSFSLLLPVKKGIKHSPEKKMKKRNRKKKSKF